MFISKSKTHESVPEVITDGPQMLICAVGSITIQLKSPIKKSDQNLVKSVIDFFLHSKSNQMFSGEFCVLPN